MSIKRALSKLAPRVSGDDSSPRRSLADFLHDKEYVYSSDDMLSEDNETITKKQQKRAARQARMEARARANQERLRSSQPNKNNAPPAKAQETQQTKEAKVAKEAKEAKAAEATAVASANAKKNQTAAAAESPDVKARYGDLPLMQSTHRSRSPLVNFENVTDAMVGQEVEFRARVHIVRRMGSKFAFIVFRQQLDTLQGVLKERPGEVSTAMVQWAERIRVGSIVRVRGALKNAPMPVVSTSFHNIELRVDEVHVITRRQEAVPFSVYEADLRAPPTEGASGRRSHISDHTRLSNRLIDLRTDASQAIFRVQSAISNLFRSALDERGFIEIHTPKLQGSATESGASVFRVDYFGRPAFLAQSPQLAKQMAVASDFERVYEIGAVFRAENSNTHRHLTEYTGLDLEMAIDEHYYEALETIDAAIKNIFNGLYTRCRREIDVVKQQFPHEDLVWLNETPIIPFPQGIKLLNDSGWRDEQGNPLSESEDLGTRDEIRLGELIKDKFKTDYYILDKFPASARPFYTMPNATNPKFTNSFDIFVRGQEIVSGGQRIHDAKMLEERMKEVDIDPSTMEEYMKGFAYGAPPHAGAGIGLERLVMLILKLGNIRLGSMFHRDPRSLPAKTTNSTLRHPNASTLHPPWETDSSTASTGAIDKTRKLQPLEDLIANYGDATSTSWADERYKIWRDYATGAAVAYVPSNSHVIIAGDPLCESIQFDRVITQFLRWLKAEVHLKPIWILCSPDVERILGEKLEWRTLSCVADERIDPSKNRASTDHEIARKIRHAENEGVKIHSLPNDAPFPANIKSAIDKRISDWLSSRKGAQVHLSEITPWRDQRHRTYYYATDREGTPCALVVLAEIAPKRGLQVKYSLDFPGSPSGTIEYILTDTFQTSARAGIKSLTFGAGATTHLLPGHNMSGAKIKVLQHSYDALVSQFRLNKKTEFRAKMGAEEVPVYIAYPRHGLGSKGIRAILNFFED